MKLQMSEDHQGQRNWVYRSSTCMVRHVPPMNPGIKPADLLEVFGVFDCKIEVWSYEKRIFTAGRQGWNGNRSFIFNFIFSSDVFCLFYGDPMV